jgi:hypothetical protein
MVAAIRPRYVLWIVRLDFMGGRRMMCTLSRMNSRRVTAEIDGTSM